MNVFRFSARTLSALLPVLRGLGLLLGALLLLAAFALLVDYGAAESAAGYERATGRTYASICADGIASACSTADALVRWGMAQ